MKLILFTTGEVTSPNYPNKYPNDLEKTQTIRVEEGLILSLQFTAFDIQSHYNCRYDHLTIMDGDGTTLMERRCGTSLPAAIRSTSNVVNLLFSTNSNSYDGGNSGWSVSWSAVTPGECQQCNLLYPLKMIANVLKNTGCFQPKQTRPCLSFLF